MAQQPRRTKLNIPLATFAQGSNVVKLYSELFKEEYWLVSEPYVGPKPNGIVYTVSEIRLLQSFKNNKELLKQIHIAKKLFNSTIIDVMPPKNISKKG